MKDHLLQLVQAADPVQGRNVLREYLQARILDVLQRAGAMVPLAFQGGTSLRFLFALPLNMVLERSDVAGTQSIPAQRSVAADPLARRGPDGADLAGSGRQPATCAGVGSGGG